MERLVSLLITEVAEEAQPPLLAAVVAPSRRDCLHALMQAEPRPRPCSEASIALLQPPFLLVINGIDRALKFLGDPFRS
jgi:hypothetical protein